MIKNATVFVLGAGTSIPYGFPSGEQLREKICSGEITHILKNVLKIDADDVTTFTEAFQKSKVSSIDSFLSRRTDFSCIGKLAISACLCDSENPEKIHAIRNEHDDDWYRLLWNSLIEDVYCLGNISANKIKFITFNYDRSLEYFLHQSAKETFGVTDQCVVEALKPIEISHVYGMLGGFRCTDEYQEGKRPYRSNPDKKSLEIAANAIKVMPDMRDENDVFEKCRKILDDAERICFLGFGFDPLNIERLGLKYVLQDQIDKGKSQPTIFASVLGKTDVEIAKAKRMICPENAWTPVSGNNTYTLRNSDLL